VTGEFDPINVVGHRADPKKLARFCVFGSIVHQNPLTGHLSEPREKINKNEKM